jgi:hypothetical protein
MIDTSKFEQILAKTLDPEKLAAMKPVKPRTERMPK